MLFQFANPYFLMLFLALPLFIFMLGKVGNRAALKYSDVSLAKSVSNKIKSRAGNLLLVFKTIALSLLILAIARPQFGEKISNIETEGIDIILAIDLSSSMFAHDFLIDRKRVDRLSAVKKVVHEFIKKRPEDRIGIVAFAGAPYLVSPLTLNHDWLLQNLNRLKIGLIEDGTAIGKAIGTGVTRLKELDSKSKIVILLTDGANNDTTISPLIAAEAAEAFKIKIYTIAAGTEGIIPYPILDRNQNYKLDSMGNKQFHRSESDIDTKTLAEISKITNAKSYRAKDTERLAKIYKEIDQLEKTEVKLTVKASFNDFFPYLLFLSTILLLTEWVLAQTIYKSFP
jgi:Ca-activated chloride channel family protein